MQAAVNDKYTAKYKKYILSSSRLTEIEHENTIRRINKVPHKVIARELDCSENNSKKTAQRVMDKLIEASKIYDNDFKPRTVEEVTKVLLNTKELIYTTASISEVAWVLSFLSNANDTGATALLFSLTAKRK
ncbi:MAG: hypothetical protein ACRBBW_12995 [Cellvibrionaceae bacterium]